MSHAECSAFDSFEQLLDDTAPTLLDFLDSPSDVANATHRSVVFHPNVKTDSQNVAKKSTTWRQRQRLEVLRLRDEVKQLDEELRKMKLAIGVRSTLPLIEGTYAAAFQTNRPAVKKFMGESWQDAASRESLARRIADIENEKLHRALCMQVKHARKLHQMMTQQMTTAAIAQALGYRPAFADDEDRPPKDNNVVFQRLLAELNGHRGNVDNIFVTEYVDQGHGNKKDGLVSINRVRGLQVQIVNYYTVPFSVEATERVIWYILAGREGNDKHKRVVYNELFEVDSTTMLQSARIFIVVDSLELCFLVRKVCRRYTKEGQTHFVDHHTSIVNTTFGAGVSYDSVVWRAVKPGKDHTGSPIATIETHVQATFPSYKTLSCLPLEDLKGFHGELKRFNHKVENLLISNGINQQFVIRHNNNK